MTLEPQPSQKITLDESTTSDYNLMNSQIQHSQDNIIINIKNEIKSLDEEISTLQKNLSVAIRNKP